MESLLFVITFAAIGAFAFLNGFRDASNSVAAAVRTRALTPRIAVVMAAFFAFVGTMLSTAFGTYLVSAVELNVPSHEIGLGILLSAVLAAGAWGLFCWWRGIPTSSTHAVISGLAGASGASALLGDDGVRGSLLMLLFGVALPLLVTPLAAYTISYLMVFPALWLGRHETASNANETNRALQSVAACAVALGHGLQDGQRSAAMLTLALTAAHLAAPGDLPLGVRIAAAALLSAGILFGGWRISHTLAYRLVVIDPLRGAVAQGVSAAILHVGALLLHLPLSTTQAVTSSIVGAGRNQRFESVQWRQVLRVLGYWVMAPVVCLLAAGILFLALYPVLR